MKHYKEIKRSDGYIGHFLRVLKELDAYHLKLVLTDNFESTDKATISNREPTEAFTEYCENTAQFDAIQKSMEQWLFKYSGGRSNDTMSENNQGGKNWNGISDFRDAMNVGPIVFNNIQPPNVL